jgi:hypothetical protein
MMYLSVFVWEGKVLKAMPSWWRRRMMFWRGCVRLGKWERVCVVRTSAFARIEGERGQEGDVW